MHKGTVIFSDGHREEILDYKKLPGGISFRCESGMYEYVNEDTLIGPFYKWRPDVGDGGTRLRTLEIDHIMLRVMGDDYGKHD